MTFTCACGDALRFDRIPDHVRLIHPDLFEDGMLAWPVEVAC